MTECFTKVFAVKVEPSNICECIAAYKEKVLIGTKSGIILVYSVSYRPTDFSILRPSAIDRKIATEFCFLLKDFNKKPILQIEVVDDFGIFIALSDGKLFVYRLTDFRCLCTYDTFKGVIRFCFDVYNPDELRKSHSKQKGSDAGLTYYHRNDENRLSFSIINDGQIYDNLKLRVCIATKVKLIILNWDNVKNKFNALENEYRLPSTPKCIQFFYESIFIGTKMEYFLMNVETSSVKSLYNVGKCQEPLAFRIADMLGIKIDETVEFIDRKGKLLENSTVRWSYVPSNIIYHPPFTIATMKQFIEVRMVSPTMYIQCLQMENVSLICRSKDRVYVMVENRLCCLISTPRHHVVQAYSDSGDFELALMLAKTSPLVGENFIDSTKINIHYAKSLYKNRNFEKAFNIFTELNIDPSHVLSLFPSLYPEKLTKDTKIQSWGEDFSRDDTIEATHALVSYLVKWRTNLRKETVGTATATGKLNNSPNVSLRISSMKCRSLYDGNILEKPRLQKLLQIVDTSLLKCYLILNSPLVAPLLRQENYCHLDETKKWLISHEKFQDLILLYDSHKMHEEALQLLHQQSVKTHSPLHGHIPTVHYLQNLDSNYLDLLYLYGDNILTKYPRAWLSIFSYWDQKIKNEADLNSTYPVYKERVLRHLQLKCPAMIVPFIERTIYHLPMNFDLDEDQDLANDKNTTQSVSLDRPMATPQLSDTKLSLLSFAVTDDVDSTSKEKGDTELPLKELKDVNMTVLHTVYAEELIKQILRMRQPIFLCKKIEDELSMPSPDNRDLYELRRRLKLFLRSPHTNYNLTRVLNELPYDALFDERATVLARQNKHEQALTIWLHVFDDWPLAEKHCQTVYSTTVSAEATVTSRTGTHQKNDIYFRLLRVCVEPCEPAELGIVLSPNDESLDFSFVDISQSELAAVSPGTGANELDNALVQRSCSVSNARFHPLKGRAVQIMKKYGDKLDVPSTIQLLSNLVTVDDLLIFVQNALRTQSSVLNQAVLLRNIQFYNKMSSNLRACESARCFFVVTDQSVCALCMKLIDNRSAVARYPDGSIVHYGCCRHLPQHGS